MTDSALAKALAEFQTNVPHIAKGNTAEVPTRSGGKYKYDYADLTDVTEIILPLLAKVGLAWTSGPTLSEHGFALHYRLLHTSGESIEGFYPLPNAAPQEIGSAITYARRYALCAVTGVAPGGDDDDAAKAQAAPSNKPARPQPARARIERAAAALNEAASLADLDNVWRNIVASGLSGVDELKTINDARARDLAGTEKPAERDEWAAEPPAEAHR